MCVRRTRDVASLACVHQTGTALDALGGECNSGNMAHARGSLELSWYGDCLCVSTGGPACPSGPFRPLVPGRRLGRPGVRLSVGPLLVTGRAGIAQMVVKVGRLQLACYVTGQGPLLVTGRAGIAHMVVKGGRLQLVCKVTGHAPDWARSGAACIRMVQATVRRLPSSRIHRGSCCLLDGSSWRCCPGWLGLEGWDPTLGYPGEGPADGTRFLPIGTANITAWSSLLGSEILGKGVGDTFPGVWAIQEHRLAGKGLRKARRHLDGAGWGSVFEPARVTAKLGMSSGTAVVWERSMVGEADVVAYTSTDCGRHRLCRATLVVEGLKIHVVSVYGDCRSEDVTLAMVEMCLGFVEAGDLWAVCGDFNVGAADMVRWLGGRGSLEVMRPGTATCFS